MGAAVFCTFEDIVRVRPRMIGNFIASIMLVDKNRRAALNATKGGDGDDDDDGYAAGGAGRE